MAEKVTRRRKHKPLIITSRIETRSMHNRIREQQKLEESSEDEKIIPPKRSPKSTNKPDKPPTYPFPPIGHEHMEFETPSPAYEPIDAPFVPEPILPDIIIDCEGCAIHLGASEETIGNQETPPASQVGETDFRMVQPLSDHSIDAVGWVIDTTPTMSGTRCNSAPSSLYQPNISLYETSYEDVWPVIRCQSVSPHMVNPDITYSKEPLQKAIAQ